MAADNDDVEVESGSVDEQAERLTQQVRDKVKAVKKEEADKEEPEETDDDGDDDAEVETDDDPSPTRREKRQNRWREMQEAREQAERRADAAMAAQQQMMQQLMAMQQPREPQVDPQESFNKTYNQTEYELIELRGMYSQRAQEYAQAGQRMPREEIDHFIGKQRELELKKQQAWSDLYVTQNNFRQDPRAQQVQTELAVLKATHADVFANKAAALHVNYAYQRMIHAEGAPDSIVTAQKAVEEARRVVLKQAATQKPSQGTKAKFTSQSTGAGGAARAGGTPVIRIGKEGERMADAALPHIKDDKKRYETWGKMMFAKDRERKASRT
jgi:hypothetical protein